MTATGQWQRFIRYQCVCESVGLRLDISRMNFPDDFLDRMASAMQQAYQAMQQLEAGAIANPDEQRMVGHYWLRAPELAPDPDITRAIGQTVHNVKDFAAKVHSRQIAPPKADQFTDVVVIGIGGSALGPQLVADALGSPADRMRVHLIDNTDPDGIDRLVSQLGDRLASTLAVVISKSGGTKETRNGMLEFEQALIAQGLTMGPQAVAVTGQGSQLDQHAQTHRWLTRFPMWDWVGGRTSVLSAVGLLPAALQGLDIDSLLAGAAEMDRCTRSTDTLRNPAALLALMWHHATNGRGCKDMVVLPYKDRLLLLSRYLQQLVMESLGKEHDLDGNAVEQGLTVYGNKGSTDQHAYVQQLRDGVHNFFVNFIVVLQDRATDSDQVFEVEPGITTGDYLNGFWQGTRQALTEKSRESLTITIDQLSPRTLGSLIALYERAVGFYASLIRVNAYHQPGVEAGKKAAGDVLALQQRVTAHMQQHPQAQTPEQIAAGIGAPQQVETVYHVLEHLAANRRHVARDADGTWRGLASYSHSMG